MGNFLNSVSDEPNHFEWLPVDFTITKPFLLKIVEGK
jgi:hypothetical protein